VAARLKNILDYFGNSTLSQLNRSACNKYVEWRGKPGAARRELADLRAAIRHHWKEGYCQFATPVVLPAATGRSRDKWLTREEAARLLRAAWRYREVQKGCPTGRHSLRHLARFILVGLYTGTRAGAICSATFERSVGRGWIDIDEGIFYRRAHGQRETKKRQPPIRLPSRLLSHIRRWRRNAPETVSLIEWNGSRVVKINKAFRSACRLAGLSNEVVPHTLRHTCATWLAQRGVPIHEICGYLGMTREIFERVYGHHHPDHQSLAVSALDKSADRLRTGSGTWNVRGA
jgi:integrase